MTPKMKLFKWIDDFYTDDLKAGERLEFEKELKNNSEFRSEVELEKEIQSALIEKDIIDKSNYYESA